MTKEDFKELLVEFFDWTSSDDRPASSWFASLETWATSKYNACVHSETLLVGSRVSDGKYEGTVVAVYSHRIVTVRFDNPERNRWNSNADPNGISELTRFLKRI